MIWPPPTEWFEPTMPDGWDPVSDLSSPIIHIDSNRRVCALVAPYNVCIVDGSDAPPSRCFTAPRSPSRYHYAMTKNHPVTQAPFAWVGWGQNHFSHELGVAEVQDAFANTASRVMGVQYHDLPDAGGVFAFGFVDPKLDDIDIDLLGMMALSGHWMRWAANGNRKQYDMLGSQVVLTEAFRREDAVRQYVSRTASAPLADTLTIDLDVDMDKTLTLEPRLLERLETHMSATDTPVPTAIDFAGQRYVPAQTGEFLMVGGGVAYKTTTTARPPAPAPEFRHETLADSVHTAAASTKSKTVTRPGDIIMGLDRVTGDGRVILSAGYQAGMDTFPVTIDHEGTLASIIGSASNFTIGDGVASADITIDLGTEFAQLAVDAFAKGAGYSVELDSVELDWWPAVYAVQHGVDIGNVPLDAELAVMTQWRVRAVTVCPTPAFTEGIPAATADTEVAETVSPELLELLRSHIIEAPIEPLEITA